MKQAIHPFTVYTTQQVAELLEVNVITVQRYIRQRKIRATKFGKWYRVSGSDLLDFMNLGRLDIPSVQLEHALISLDLDHPLRGGSNENSPFYNLGSAMIKRIATESPTRADLLVNLAHFILKTKGFLPSQNKRE